MAAIRKVTKPEFFQDFDDNVLLDMLGYASTIFHDLYKSPDLNKAILTAVTTEIGRWDCKPGALIGPLDILPEEKVIKLYMKGCTCSESVNKALVAEFTVPFIHTGLLTDRAYLLAEPEVLGGYERDGDAVKAIVRPVGSFHIQIEK